MALKWFRRQQQPSPNVYLIPGDSSFIVSPEFDFPLPSFPLPATASCQDDERTGIRTRLLPHNQDQFVPPVLYHYPSLSVRDNETAAGDRSTGPPPYNNANNSFSSHNATTPPTEPIGRSTTRSKLRKSPSHAQKNLGRASDPGLHWPTSLPIATDPVQAVTTPGATASGNRLSDSPGINVSSSFSAQIATTPPTKPFGRSATRTKLRKPPSHVPINLARASDPGLHWPTSVPIATLNPVHDLSDTSVGAINNRLSEGADESARSSFYSSTISTFEQSASSVGSISRTVSFSSGNASRKNSLSSRKLTKRKRPPPPPLPDPISFQNDHAAPDSHSLSVTPNTHQRPSQDNHGLQRTTSAAYTRFWNLSVPDLPTNPRHEHTPHVSTLAVSPNPILQASHSSSYMARRTVPGPSPDLPTNPRHENTPYVSTLAIPPNPILRASHSSSYMARRTVPGPSPLRDRADMRVSNEHTKEKDVSDLLQDNKQADSDRVSWPEKYPDDVKRPFPSLGSTSSTTLTAFSLYGIHDVGENKIAWRSTWSVEDTSSDNGPKRNTIPTSFSAGDLNNRGALPKRCLHDSSPRRPQMVRRNAEDSLRRRWTVAATVTDESIDDEALHEQLERIRRRGETENVNVYGGPQARLQHARRRFSRHHATLSPTRWLGVPDGPVWQTARSALLTCRELVRTERSYLAQIRLLIDEDGTATTTPGLMMTYVPALVHASELLLKHMLEDPNAWGIASAFVKCEGVLESAFVKWCGIVGGFFVKESEDTASGGSDGEGAAAKRTMSGSAKITADAIRRRNSMSVIQVRPRSKTFPPVRPFLMQLMKAKSNGKTTEGEKRAGRPSVRDLAILPTQRVMRYVLLYRGLLEHTPSPPSSRAMVEDALRAALAIAQKCDRAQDNAEFLMC